MADVSKGDSKLVQISYHDFIFDLNVKLKCKIEQRMKNNEIALAVGGSSLFLVHQ